MKDGAAGHNPPPAPVAGEGGDVEVPSRDREWGCVHGRFQPFHCGHLEYVLRARERCRRLVVGITNPDPSWIRAEAESAHRHEPEANPFGYLERSLMIRDSLLDEGLDLRDFAIVPFPIQDPGRCRYYVPDGTFHFVRAFSNWEREKVRRLRAEGFAVELLDPGGEKEISGTDVRRRMHLRLPWEHLVPPGTAAVAKQALAAHPGRMKGSAR
ncbi:MAG: adenylyltransferase/cytidyltransferase family protein [Actinomycetota bacterium]|nr:adenylyltransferase/cytidyltransferase family protein [Actinomycetota bacterium]